MAAFFIEFERNINCIEKAPGIFTCTNLRCGDKNIAFSFQNRFAAINRLAVPFLVGRLRLFLRFVEKHDPERHSREHLIIHTHIDRKLSHPVELQPL